jgi:uncharacterized membrane protein/ketosteroid isomerase-like protein
MIKIIPNWHPVLVNFTIALLVISAVLFLVRALAGSSRPLRGIETAANWNLWLGAAVTVLTVAAGLNAAATVPHDEPAHIAMESHETWALGTAALFMLLAVWNGVRVRRDRNVGWLFVAMMIVASAGLVATGSRGADLVFGHGLGVASLPEVSGAGHAHEHGAERSHATPPAITTGASAPVSPADADVISALESYHAALTSGDATAVERWVTPDEGFAMIEGKHANSGWADYRDHHLSGELKDLSKVRFRLSVNRVQQDGTLAYVSFDYSVLPKEGPERNFGRGLATAVLVKTDTGWKIRHLHTS